MPGSEREWEYEQSWQALWHLKSKEDRTINTKAHPCDIALPREMAQGAMKGYDDLRFSG